MCGSRPGLVCESGREAMQTNKNISNSLLTVILINERDVPSSSKKVVHLWLRHNVQQLHLAMSSLNTNDDGADPDETAQDTANHTADFKNSTGQYCT